MSQINVNTGEQLTFIDLFTKYDNLFIEIPIIQRDYAQGRSTNVEVRNLFLDTLFKTLEEDIPISLDFIYGSILNSDRESFVPLDGQQRLTTLFLLHIYLANKDDKLQDLQNKLAKGESSRFTYKTRISSTEFCDGLLQNQLNLDELLLPDDKEQNSLSKTIKNQSWFFLSWERDPTIKSMLTMLDTIHQKFYNSDGFYEKILSNSSRLITFQFLNIDEFRLTDELYIKMNARGRHLTDFENFKAKFEQFVSSVEFDSQLTHKLTYNGNTQDVKTDVYFSHQIDRAWADIFWKYKEKFCYDNQIMHFLHVVITNHFAKNSRNSEDSEDYSKLKELVNSQHYSYFRYEEINSFDGDLILFLIDILDSLSEGDKKIKTYLENKFYYDEDTYFKRILKSPKDLSYADRIMFFAFYRYLSYHKSETSGLFDWARVIHNLTENTEYNKLEDYIRSLRAIETMLPISNTIVSSLSTGKTGNISSFNRQQIKEEVIKAMLIQKGAAWKNAILSAEQHGYYKGQIGFLLDFSGILAYFDKNENCDWDSDKNQKYFEAFKTYNIKSNLIFDDNGLIKFPDFIWECALLSQGNYLLKESRNYSFFTRESKNRDISWKALLKNEKRKYVKEVLDNNYFDVQDVQDGLCRIISKRTNAGNWLDFVIRNPQTIRYCQQRYIRWYSNEEIYLLGSSQMNHYYAELYSYSFYNEYLQGENAISIAPFENCEYVPVRRMDEHPCIMLSNWVFNRRKYVLYIEHYSDGYIIYLEHNIKTINQRSYEGLEDVLEELGFKWSDDYCCYQLFNDNECDIYKYLKSTLKALGNL